MQCPDLDSYESLRHLMRALHRSSVAKTNGEGYYEAYVSPESFRRLRDSFPDAFKPHSDHAISAFGIKVMPVRGPK